MFACIATFEYWIIKNNGSLLVLSEQQLIDCDKNNGGCPVGNPLYSLLFAATTGVAGSANYAYTSGATGKNGTCQKTIKTAWTLSDFCYGPLGTESALLGLLYNYGPMVVVMDASDPGFANYQSGVFTSTTCSKKVGVANLAVVRISCNFKFNRKLMNVLKVVVGYGTDVTSGLDFWIARSSFGKEIINEQKIMFYN